MPQDSLSSTTQSIGNVGLTILTCQDNAGTGADVTIQLNPTYARMVNPQYAPRQHVNVSLEGGWHIFQYSGNEPLIWPMEIMNLPSFDLLGDPREQSQGYLTLLSFIRYTLNYHQSTCIITNADGFIETMRYAGGIDSLAEADRGQGNTAQRAQRWAGTLTWVRVLGG